MSIIQIKLPIAFKSKKKGVVTCSSVALQTNAYRKLLRQSLSTWKKKIPTIGQRFIFVWELCQTTCWFFRHLSLINPELWQDGGGQRWRGTKIEASDLGLINFSTAAIAHTRSCRRTLKKKPNLNHENFATNAFKCARSNLNIGLCNW